MPTTPEERWGPVKGILSTQQQATVPSRLQRVKSRDQGQTDTGHALEQARFIDPAAIFWRTPGFVAGQAVAEGGQLEGEIVPKLGRFGEGRIPGFLPEAVVDMGDPGAAMAQRAMD
jgi:hypothetical protein